MDYDQNANEQWYFMLVIIGKKNITVTLYHVLC